MSKKQETIFKERIYPELKALPFTWVVKVQQVTKRGTPDFILCVAGVFCAIELKKSSKEAPDALQEYNLDLIGKCGGLSIVMYPENEVKVIAYLKRFAAHAAKDKTKKERIQ